MPDLPSPVFVDLQQRNEQVANLMRRAARKREQAAYLEQVGINLYCNPPAGPPVKSD